MKTTSTSYHSCLPAKKNILPAQQLGGELSDPAVILADEDPWLMRSVEISLQLSGYRLELKEHNQAVSFLQEVRESKIDCEVIVLHAVDIIRYVKSQYRKGDKVILLKAREMGAAPELLEAAAKKPASNANKILRQCA